MAVPVSPPGAPGRPRPRPPSPSIQPAVPRPVEPVLRAGLFDPRHSPPADPACSEGGAPSPPQLRLAHASDPPRARAPSLAAAQERSPPTKTKRPGLDSETSRLFRRAVLRHRRDCDSPTRAIHPAHAHRLSRLRRSAALRRNLIRRVFIQNPPAFSGGRLFRTTAVTRGPRIPTALRPCRIPAAQQRSPQPLAVRRAVLRHRRDCDPPTRAIHPAHADCLSRLRRSAALQPTRRARLPPGTHRSCDPSCDLRPVPRPRASAAACAVQIARAAPVMPVPTRPLQYSPPPKTSSGAHP